MVEQVDQKQSPVFNDYSRYYDLLYRDKDYQVEADYVAGLIHRFHPDARSILELGSGTGKHALLLAQKGFLVYGVERSPEMLKTARQNAANHPDAQASNLCFFQGDIRTIRLQKHFDAVIALFHVISYQTTNDDVISTFRTAWEHLNSDGLFIFDVWYGPAVLTQRPEVRIKRIANEKIEVTRLAEPVLHPNENLVDVNYHIFVRDRETAAVKELKEAHVMRYFFYPEIELIANQSGFLVLHAEEWVTGNQLDQNTWGAVFILRASMG